MSIENQLSIENQADRIAKVVGNLKVILGAAIGLLSIAVVTTVYVVHLKTQFEGYESRIKLLEEQTKSLSKIATWANPSVDGTLYPGIRGIANFAADCPPDTFATGLRVWGSDADHGTGNVSQIKLNCRRLNTQ